MMENLIEREKIDHLRMLLNRARRVVITCHLSPDGDAMGSSLGLCRVLRNAGKEVKVITPDSPPKYLMFLPGAEHIVVYSRFEAFANKILAETDLIFCLDYNDGRESTWSRPECFHPPRQR